MGIADICFFDTETRARVLGPDGDVTEAGAHRYVSKGAYPILLTYAIGDGEVGLVEPSDFSVGIQRHDFPDDLGRFYAQTLAVRQERFWAAWNTTFDRLATRDLLKLKIEETLDIMAQAVASNLPPKLEGASKFIGRAGKQHDGKELIKLFCRADGGTPQSHPEEWARFKSYAVQDVVELREVYRATRPLPLSEWREYWASERINDRGIMVDIPFAERAAAVAEAEMIRTNEMVRELTDKAILKITQNQKLGNWLWDNIEYAEAREILVTEVVEEPDSEDDTVVVEVAKLSVKRDNVTRLIAFYRDLDERLGLTDHDDTVLQVLELREFGASATPKKYTKILETHDEGILRGQYTFNGAQQTGRYSSRGVQVHNLNRSSLGAVEAEAIELINDLDLEAK